MITKYFLNKRNKEILNFLKYDRKFLIEYLSFYGQLDFYQINKLQSILEFYGISNNISVSWSIELIDQFKERWNWGHLSRNVSLNWWSETLLKYFEDKWDWIELSDNKNLNLNINLIDLFKTKWNWKSSKSFSERTWHGKIITGICGNKSIHWDYEKIKKFEDLIDWSALSLNPNIKFDCNTASTEGYCRPKISYYKYPDDEGGYYTEVYSLLSKFKNWDFKNLSYNPGLGRNLHSHETDIVVAFLTNYEFDWTGISCNSSIPWTIYLIKGLNDWLDWKSFSHLVPKAYNSDSFSWSFEFIEEHKDNLDWSALSINPSLPWSLDFLDRYKDMWDWRAISLNNGIPWSKKLLSKYENKLYWDLSEFPWDRKLIRKFQDKIDWEKISQNNRVKWSLPTLKKHYLDLNLDNIFTNELENPLTWEFYRFFLKDRVKDSKILLKNKHFCENIIKPLLKGENFETVLKEYLSRFYHPELDPIKGNQMYYPINIGWKNVIRNGS